MKSLRKKIAGKERPVILFSSPRYRDLDFWLGSMLDDVGSFMLREALASGYQLSAERVVPSIRPAVLILATYAREFESTEIVDDYDHLLSISKTKLGGYHVDKFLASCICILSDRGMAPSEAGFISQNIPAILAALSSGG